MAFLSPLLLAGVALIGIPIVLHLRRRRDPVRVEFPALRLLKRNRQRTETQLKVRRRLLLALRCLLLTALVGALARPLLKPPGAASADGAADGPAGTSTALALVVDNGPNAAYQSRNRSRLEAAQGLAEKLLAKLPSETPLVLADRSAGVGAVNLEPATASARVQRIRQDAAARPLGSAVRDALTALAETPASRREAYVFTDLSAGAWGESDRRAVAAVLDEHPRIALRLVDVGATEPRNAAIDALRVASESLAIGEALTLTAALHLVGEWKDPVAVQLWIEGPSGPVKRDERLVDPAEAGAIDFSIAGLPEGFTTGFVRAVAGDAAPADDVRHFAVEVRRPRSVLVVAPTIEGTVFFRSAIDPAVSEPGVTARYETEAATYDGWARRTLTGYDAVVLCDPPPAIERGRGWRRLYDLAASGGGVGVFLGREATLDAFNSPDAQALLPAELVWRSREPTYFRPRSLSHPAVKPLAPFADDILWPLLQVDQRWETDEPHDGGVVVARYADGAAAILERGVGRGRVVLMTTSVSDPRNRPDAWNTIPTGEQRWPFVLLAGGIADYLTGAAESRLSFTAGQPVTVSLPVGLDSPGYVLRTPSGEALRETIPPGRGELSIPAATEPGSYRLETGGAVDRRFVVNLDTSAGHVERVPFDELAESLGAERVELVRGPDQLVRAVDLGRVGRELYGWVLAIAAAALLSEQWVGNRFYRDSGDQA